MMKCLIAVDLGTTGVKVSLLDSEGRILQAAEREQKLRYPRPGWAEQVPEAWYETPCELIRELLEKNGTRECEVSGIGFSSQGISVVLTDECFRPLADGISWLDIRAEEELKEVFDAITEAELFDRTGKPANPAYTLPKLLWLKKHEPELFNRAKWFLMPMDYCIARMTGSAVTDPTMASGTMLANLNGDWIPELTERFGIPIEKLPRVVPGGTVAGGLNEETVQRTGLPAGIPVVVGAQDQKIAAFGAGIDETHPTLSLGTAGAIECITGERSGCIPAFPYLDGRRMLLECCINTAGAAIRWIKNLLYSEEGYGRMNEEIERSPIGANGVVFRPYLSGAGTPHVGEMRSGTFEGLTLCADRGDIARAVYEGIACEVRWNIEEARKAGAAVEALIAFGGGVNSTALMKIISGICQVPIEVCRQSEMALIGAARSAAEAVGIETGDFGRGEGVLRIRPEQIEKYEAVYDRYRNNDRK